MFYLITDFFLDDIYQKIYITTFLEILLLTVSLSYLVRVLRLFPKIDSWIFSVLVVTGANVLSINSDAWIYFYSNNVHFAALWGPILLVAWFARGVISGRMRSLLIAPVILGLCLFSTSTILFLFVIPALTLILLAWLFRDRKASPADTRILQKSLLWALVVLVGGIVISGVLNAALIHYASILDSPYLSIDAVLFSPIILAYSVMHSLSPANPIGMLLSILILMIIIAALRYSTKTLTSGWRTRGRGPLGWNRDEWLCLGYLLVFCCNFLGVVFSGVFQGVESFRYFSLSIVLSVVVATRWFLLVTTHSGATRFRRRVSQGLLVTLAAGLVTLSLYDVVHYRNLPQQTGLLLAEEFQLLRSTRSFDLGFGIGDYWHARYLSYYSKGKPEILQVKNDGSPFFWMVSTRPYRQALETQKVNFAIVRPEDAPGAFQFSEKTMASRLPEPDAKIRLAGDGSFLWYYKDDRLFRFLQPRFRDFIEQTSEPQVAPSLVAVFQDRFNIGRLRRVSDIIQTKIARVWASFISHEKRPE